MKTNLESISEFGKAEGRIRSFTIIVICAEMCMLADSKFIELGDECVCRLKQAHYSRLSPAKVA